MATLTITAEDVAAGDAIREEADQIMEFGATDGLLTAVPPLTNYTDMDAESREKTLDMVEAIGVATSRRVVERGVSDNTPDTLVKRDDNGDFAAGNVTVDQISFEDGTSMTTAPSGGSSTSTFSKRIDRGYVPRDYSNVASIVWCEIAGGAVPTWSNSDGGWMSDAYGNTRRFATTSTSTTLNNVSGMENGTTSQLITAGYLKPVLSTHIRTESDISDVRIWVALGRNGIGQSDVGGSILVSSIGFRFSTAAGDTNWKAVTWNRGSGTVVDTGVVVSTDTAYHFQIEWGNGEIIYYINGNQVATIPTNLPDNGDPLAVQLTVCTLSTGNRLMSVGIPVLVSNLINPEF